MKPRRADIYGLGLDAFFGDQRLQSLQNSRFPRGFLRAFSAQRLDAILLQAQTARLIDLKLGQLEAARPKINRQK